MGNTSLRHLCSLHERKDKTACTEMLKILGRGGGGSEWRCKLYPVIVWLLETNILRHDHGNEGSRQFEDRVSSCPAQKVRKYSHNVTILKIYVDFV